MEGASISVEPFSGTPSDLENFVKMKGILCVVEFFSNSCPPCRPFSNVFEEIATQYLEICFIKINVVANSDIAKRFNVSSLPSVKFFKWDQNLKLLGTIIGNRPDEIKLAIENLK